MVVAGEGGSVHHVLILVGRGGVHGVHYGVKTKVLLKCLVWEHFGH